MLSAKSNLSLMTTRLAPLPAWRTAGLLLHSQPSPGRSLPFAFWLLRISISAQGRAVQEISSTAQRLQKITKGSLPPLLGRFPSGPDAGATRTEPDIRRRSTHGADRDSNSGRR